MRWFSIICTVLVTNVLGNERPKRTIPLSFLGIPQEPPRDDNLLLYKIPGYDDILLKLTPKIQKTSASVNLNIGSHNSPLPYKCNDEPNGFQKLVDIIKTGISNKKQILKNIFAPPTPMNPVIIIKEQTKPIVIQKVVEQLPPPVGLKYTEKVEIDTQPVAVPKAKIVAKTVAKPVVKQKQVVTSVVQPKYSYKQASKDGTVMSYEFEDNPNVIVSETVAMPPLPPYIKSRFEEIVSATVVPSLPQIPGAVITEDISISQSIVPGNFGNVITPLPPVAAPIYPPAFVRLQNLGYFEGGEFYGPPILVEEDIPVLLRKTTDIFKLPGPKGDVNVKISKNKQPTFINRKTSAESVPLKVDYGTNIRSNSMSQMAPSKAIPPPPSLPDVGQNSISNVKTSSVQAPISQTFVSSNQVTDNTVISNDHGSSFVYKQVTNKNREPLDISQAAVSSNLNLGNKNGEIDNVSNKISNYYFVPDKRNTEPPPIKMERFSAPTPENIQRLSPSNSGSMKPCLDNTRTTKSSLCPEPDFQRIDVSLKNSPIMVPDTSFVYKQVNADGSSMSMLANHDNVVVDVKERNSEVNRGDIPQIGYK